MSKPTAKTEELKQSSIEDNTGKPPPTNNAAVRAIEITDVYDKKLKYVSIENEWGKVIISVGDKTFNNVQKLTK